MKNSSEMKVFNNLWNEIDSAYHEAALKLGLSDSAMLILYTVCNKGGECLLGDITHFSGISKQTVNSALRKLEAKDIICLEAVGLRKKKVCLTDKGNALSENTVFKIIDIENRICGSWTKDEISVYLKLTEKFLSSFREEIKKL